MAKIKILQKDAQVLRERAENVLVKDIKTERIKNIIKDMKTSMHGEDDGVAIAAPQIGESLSIFVVNGDMLAWTSKSQESDTKSVKAGSKKMKDSVFINPEIIKSSKKTRKMEEGCLSIRYLYGLVKRSEKITIRAYDENGKKIQRGASGILAQVFQHEIDHLNGILFIDKAENIRDIPPLKNTRFVFFGSSPFSKYVLDELGDVGLSPLLTVDSAKISLPKLEELKKLEADVFVVASFGKILPKEIIELPKYGSLNVHPSLLPKLRGASPIQSTILGHGDPGITIIKMDGEVDHGPMLAQARVEITPWPDHYRVVEKKLGRIGGKILVEVISRIIENRMEELAQDDSQATFTKLIKKDDGLLDLSDPAEVNLRKVLAYSTWPGAYMFYKNKHGKDIRLVVKDVEIKNGTFLPTRVVPAGKKEMGWQDFLRGNEPS